MLDRQVQSIRNDTYGFLGDQCEMLSVFLNVEFADIFTINLRIVSMDVNVSKTIEGHTKTEPESGS